jgi:hypothetical protein
MARTRRLAGRRLAHAEVCELNVPVVGAIVWLALAGALATWYVLTTAVGPGRLPGVVDVGRWFLGGWLGRFLLLAAWAGAGWHVFCQRP